jgi:apolipoprotein N-acyltransferase
MKLLAYFFAFIAGCLLPLAFAPHCIFPLAIISLLLLLIILNNASPQKAFYYGLSFGIGAFGVGASWIFVSIYEYGNPNIFVAGIITGLFVFILALFHAFNAYFLNRCFPKQTPSRVLLAFPASWTLIEWIRSWILSGFPWLLLGHSQINSPLHGFAPLFGVYGISFIAALSAGLLYTIIKNQHRPLSILIFIFIWVSGFACGYIHWTTPQPNSIKVTLVQGNIPMSVKWSPDAAISSLQTYENLTEEHWDSQLVIWPETAITLLPHDAVGYLEKLDKKGNKNHTAIITGIPIPQGNQDDNYYNSVVLLGAGHGHYYKRHLVPFGEYVPLSGLMNYFMQFFNFPMSTFVPGPMQQELLDGANIKIAPYICYEIAFPSIVRTDLPQANLLVVLSNDSWFGQSAAMYQQRQIAQFAALSTGRYLLSATNGGQTAIIDPHGRVIASAPIDQSTTLSGTVYSMIGSTPWVSYGDMPIIILLMLLLGYAWRANRLK